MWNYELIVYIVESPVLSSLIDTSTIFKRYILILLIIVFIIVIINFFVANELLSLRNGILPPNVNVIEAHVKHHAIENL